MFEYITAMIEFYEETGLDEASAFARAELAALKADRAKLLEYAFHKSGCAYHYGQDCDCGYAELKQEPKP